MLFDNVPSCEYKPEMISLSQESIKLAHRVFIAELVAFFNRVNFADDVDDVVLHDIAFTF